jgi:predicted ArsR family transcriptional regulator
MTTPVPERARRHRAGLRAAGLPPVQIGAPDTGRPSFAAECRRQSRLLRHDPHEAETLGWLEAMADTDGWR